MRGLLLSVICVHLSIFTGEITQKRIVKDVVLGDPDWIQKVTVLLCNLIQKLLYGSYNQSNWHWWAYWTKHTLTHLAPDSSVEGKDPLRLECPGDGCCLLYRSVGAATRAHVKQPVPTSENCRLSSWNKQMILLVRPQSFEGDVLRLTDVKAYIYSSYSRSIIGLGQFSLRAGTTG